MKLKAEKRVTIYEIARKAGCSAMTVSRALMFKRKENDRISKETEELIQQLAKEMGYKPNLAARGLILKRTFNVGFHINRTFSYFNALWKPLLRSLQRELETAGYQLGFYYFDASDHEELANFLKPPRRVDALITLGRNLSRREVQTMLDSKIPCISLMEKVDGFHSLLIDDTHGGRLIAEHLVDQGFNEVTLVSRPLAKKRWNGRTDGFLAAAKKLGLKVHELNDFLDPAYDEEYAWHTGKVAPDFARRLQKLKAAGKCVYCTSDAFAQGIARHLEENGQTIGADVSVIAYDDSEDQGELDTSATVSRVTTLERPREELGRTAAQIIIEEESDPVTEIFLPRLVDRGSVGGTPRKRVAAPADDLTLIVEDASAPVEKPARGRAAKAPKAKTPAKVAAPKAAAKPVKAAKVEAPAKAAKAAAKPAVKSAVKAVKSAKAPAKPAKRTKK